MPNTWSQIYFHIVFGTKHRTPWIDATIKTRLWAFMGGIVREQQGTALDVGGIADHSHLIVKWRTNEDVATLVQNVKARSSRWIHEAFPALREFAWQEGYGVFSVSHSNVAEVRRYIQRQEEHHRGRTFESEFLEMLRLNEIEFEERYVFD